MGLDIFGLDILGLDILGTPPNTGVGPVRINLIALLPRFHLFVIASNTVSFPECLGTDRVYSSCKQVKSRQLEQCKAIEFYVL